jgi:glycosyltransferase involved in cell wall biosynthesis
MEKTQDKLVSVIIPTYNRAHLIGETIQSVMRQTYSNWEIIVVDDGSSDETSETVRQFTDLRLQYHRIEHTGTIGAVRNYGIKRSKGEFIAFLDSDDLWLPGKLQQQVDALDHTGVTFVFTQVKLFGDTTVVVPVFPGLHNKKLLPYYLREGHFVFYPSTLMFRKSALEKTGFMNEAAGTGGDTDLFVKLCHHFRGTFLPACLAQIRKHPLNTSSEDHLLGYTDTIELFQGFYQKGYLSPSHYRFTAGKLYYKMGLLLLRHRQYGRSLECFRKYVTLRPFHWKGWGRMIQIPLLRVFR